MIYTHNLSPFLIEFSEGFGIRWYGVMYLLGFLLGYAFLKRYKKELSKNEIDIANSLIKKNDNEFKSALDHYKYHIKYPKKTKHDWRSDCLFFFEILEKQLSNYYIFISVAKLVTLKL